jgi:NodT family efflux transporter outer membrane factor (OMF) lipoprotein
MTLASPRLLSLCATLVLAGCASAPAYVRPDAPAPQDWSQWRSGDAHLHPPVATGKTWPKAWWTVLGDPVLDDLERSAVNASPDLRTAALRFAQSRTQRSAVAAQAGPQVKANASAVRQRQSENGAATRLLDALGGDRDRLASMLSQPFTLYQAGFDASWELDLWGRVSHAVEAADADVAAQASLLALARLTLASDVARHYLQLRTAQQQLQVLREDLAAQQDRLLLLQARVKAGVLDELDPERQRAELFASQAQTPSLMAQEAAAAGQIELLLGEPPGALRDTLAASNKQPSGELPELALGLPSEVAQRRPDIQAAEARLRRATANIGVARADLYPSIRLGARAGLESFKSGEFADWGSRIWSIGPSLDLPLFDRGRRVRVVHLRELEQQEAAVNYQRTVLQAWHEIDSTLNAYAAAREQLEKMLAREDSTRQVLELAVARFNGGTVDYTAVIDGQRGLLQARRDRVSSESRLKIQYVALNRTIAAIPDDDERN